MVVVVNTHPNRMYINGRNGGGEVNRAMKRMVQQAMAKECHTITILTREENGEKIYQWGSNQGDWYSPKFTDVQIAFRYPKDVGLKLQPKDAE